MYVKDTPQQFMRSERYEIGFTIAGYNSDGDPELQYLSSYDSFTPNIMHNYYIAGIPGLGDYIMARLSPQLFGYENKKVKPLIGLDGIERLASIIISETKKVNEHVGGQIQMATVTRTSGFAFVSNTEVDKISMESSKLMDETKLIKKLKMFDE